MKTLLKTLCLTVYTLLLFTAYPPEEPEIYEKPLFYTDYLENSCISYAPIGDSVHK